MSFRNVTQVKAGPIQPQIMQWNKKAKDIRLVYWLTELVDSSTTSCDVIRSFN